VILIWLNIKKFIGCLFIIHGVIWLFGTFIRFYVLPNMVHVFAAAGNFSYALNIVFMVFQVGLGLFLVVEKWRPRIWWFVSGVTIAAVVVVVAYLISRGNKPAFGIGA